MLIIPLNKKTAWKSFPLVTVCLIVFNILIYGTVQNNNPVSSYYFSAKLDQYEFPHYLQHLKIKKPALLKRLQSLPAQQQAMAVYKTLTSDQAFNRQLNSGVIIRVIDKNFAIWEKKHNQYKILNGQISNSDYGTTLAYNSIKTAALYLFLHADTKHLLGNMLLLLLLGFALEKVLGRLIFTFAYFASGIFATTLYILTNTSPLTPIIGATGAISGLMAILIIVFGLRKIQFYYWLIFYANYFRAPAMIIFPVWLANLSYQVISIPLTASPYLIHLSAISISILIALIFKTKRTERRNALIEQPIPIKEPNYRQSINAAMHAIASLNYRKAAALFRTLLHDYPNNLEILQHYHAVLIQLPVTDAYHTVTLRLLKQPVSTRHGAESCLHKYKQYLKRTGNSTRIKSTHTLKLAKTFARFGLVHEAEKIICTAIKHRPDEPVLPELLLVLANAFLKINQEEIQIHYLSLLVKSYPHTEEALIATTFLYEKPVQHLKVH
ncbi:hypothetical protein MNBD_GAMMA12-656 [hydrothermal vent metagenome]|uniref:Peptidase S54 rhomboid domain-containing protein n=1 Tax=hydrothermal vent metagenome TaxID=652676 RepID=A0A3B0YK37_9ZZZZ